jgi:hypothetical protein
MSPFPPSACQLMGSDSGDSRVTKLSSQLSGVRRTLAETHPPLTLAPKVYPGAGEVLDHGSHDGLGPASMDNSILHIIVACDGPQGA